MDMRASEGEAVKNVTTTTREELELVVTRTFDGPARIVFEAWSKPELLKRWWVPKSFGITMVSCEADVRTGGSYRFVFAVPGSDQTMAFFGKYLDVRPHSLLVWTNEESDASSVTTVTLTETDGKTLLVLRDRYPSKEALDEAIASGSTGAYPEQFEALDELIAG